MASGVGVAEETIELYRLMKMCKTNFRYVMLHIDGPDIKIQSTCDRNDKKTQEEEFDDFKESLPDDIGRYCILDLKVPQKSGQMKDQLFIITWCPSTAKTKSNIMYTTSKPALMDKIREGMIDIQANDASDLIYSEFLEKGCK